MPAALDRLRRELRAQFGDALNMHILRALDEVEDDLVDLEHERDQLDFAADWFAAEMRRAHENAKRKR